MWSVALFNNSGSMVKVLCKGEKRLSGATSFAAGFGQSAKGSIVVLTDAALDELQLPTDRKIDAVASSGQSLPTGDNAGCEECAIVLADLETETDYPVEAGLSHSEATEWVASWDARSKNAVAIAWPQWAGDPLSFAECFAERSFKRFNVFATDGSNRDREQVNSEPWDIEQVAFLLTQLDVASVSIERSNRRNLQSVNANNGFDAIEE